MGVLRPSEEARQALARAERSTPAHVLARSGFAASGLVQALVGVLAIRVGAGAGGEADQSGALAAVMQAPFGAVLVALVAVGGLALGLWLIAAGVLKGGRPERMWQQRLRDWGKAVVYLAVAVTAIRAMLGSRDGSRESSRQASSILLATTGGQVVLFAAGLVVAGVGVALVVLGVTRRFEKTIEPPAGDAGRAVVGLGMAGYSARGTAIAVVGVLLVTAAVTADPNRATGLDGALKAFAGLPFGQVVLIAIGIGWIASGIYSCLRARFAILD